MKQNKIPRNEYIRKPVGKTNPYKEDTLYTDMGQWKYPGQVTKIPSGDITMQGVPYPVYGEDNLGYSQMMYPGMDYQFPGQYVTEYPQIAKYGGGLLNKTLTCPKCGWSWKAVDGGKDIATCHKCGGTAKLAYGGDPSLPNIEGHYPFGGIHTKTHTHMSKGGWLNEYPDGGSKREPIYVENPNDSRLRAYTDSLTSYNFNKAALDKLYKTGKTPKGTPVDLSSKRYVTREQGINEDFNDLKGLLPNITRQLISDDWDYVDTKKGKLNRSVGAYKFKLKNSNADFTLKQYKKPVQPVVYKKSEEEIPWIEPKVEKKKETINPDYLPMIQASMPEMISKEPEIIMPSAPKPSNTNNRIAWRMDPDTRKMVPVYLEGKTQKVKEGKRLYNKNIPSSTAGIPADFVPQFKPDSNNDVVSKQMGGWLDEYVDEYRRGGQRRKRGTSKNIQSSINDVFRRNYDVFGPAGKHHFNPRAKYEEGGWLDQYQNAGSTGVRQPIIPDLTSKKQKVYTDAEAEALNKKALAESTAQAKKEYIDDYVKQGTKQALLESPFNLAASFTPVGTAIFAGQSGAQAIQDVANDDYLSAGINAAFALPLVGKTKKLLKGLPKGANPKAISKYKKQDAVRNIKNKISSQKADTYQNIRNLRAERPDPNKFLSGEKKLKQEEIDFISKNPPTEGVGFYKNPTDPNYLYNFETYPSKSFEQMLSFKKKKMGGWLDKYNNF